MIEIVAVSYNGAPLPHALSACFDQAGGGIGRSDDNHLVLPDPKHHVSRLQASVSSDGEQHQITNLSQANPTLLNSAELPCDVPRQLRAGDDIQIGMYLLRARVMHAPATATQGTAPLHAMTQNTQRAAAPVVPAATVDCATPAAAAAAPAPVAAHDPQELLQAFMTGAGISAVTLSAGLTPELMHTVGALLGAAVDGTVDLLAMRALVKREANADVTMVVVRKNNPLKFLPDGATVLTQMLRKRMPGFMTPVEAMQDAFDDLHGHQLGLMAGLRASLQELQQRLDPEVLVAADNSTAPLDWLIPAQRKARLWDRYCTLHRQAAATAAGDAQVGLAIPPMATAVFGAAYERASEAYKDEAANGR